MMNEQDNRVIDQEFKEELLQSLNKLRTSKVLCDTTLQTGEQQFAAHRCVLSAASPYFRALFTNELKEKNSSFVELAEISGAVLSEVLHFLYTGEAKIDSTNAQDLVVASDYLLVPNLKSKASDFLEGTIDASNCLALESLASHLNCESLKQAAKSYKIQNFVAVAKSDDFKSLDAENVKELICDDELNVAEEEEVYEAVISWVKHDLTSRKSLFPEFMKCVRLFSMSKYSLRKILDKEELVFKNPACTSILLGGLDFYLFPDRFKDLNLKSRASLQTTELAVVLTGGHKQSGSQSEKTMCFVLSTMKWLPLPTMPCPRTRHGAAVCGEQLYVVGGNLDAPVCYFNPSEKKWLSSNERLAARPHCTVCAHGGLLYVIGGKGDSWCAADVYNPSFNAWKHLSPMAVPRSAHCAVVLDDLIYLIAGHDSSVCHKSVECYDPSTDQWRQLPDLINARQFAAAATTGGKIIVVGGFSDMDFQTIEASCEIFDPRLNQWSLVSSPVVPRAACGIIRFDRHVYLFGGSDANLAKYKLDSVECYSVQEDKWQVVATMPEKLSCLQASLLKLPKKFT